MTRLSLWAAAPPWRLACWSGCRSGLAALRQGSRLHRPTALRPVWQHSSMAAACSSSSSSNSSSSSGQPGSEAEGQQVAIISSQPNDYKQRQLWQQAYNQVLAFQQAHGRLPRMNATTVVPLLEGERRLGRWCVLQRRRKDGSKGRQLSAEERAALEAIPGWEWDRAWRTRKEWGQWLQEVESFVAQHERLPRTAPGETSPFLPGERQLGRWCDNQRQRYRGLRKPLSAGEEAALAAILGWFWEQWRQQDWKPRYQQVVAFQQQHGRLPRQKGSSSRPLVEDEQQLGIWCMNQRQCYKGQQQPALKPGEEAALATIPGWFWEQHDYWEQQYQRVMAFQQQHGRLPRQKGSRSQPLVEEEQQLGNWCTTQRHRCRGQKQQEALTPEQQAALEVIPGWFWEQHKKAP